MFGALLLIASLCQSAPAAQANSPAPPAETAILKSAIVDGDDPTALLKI